MAFSRPLAAVLLLPALAAAQAPAGSGTSRGTDPRCASDNAGLTLPRGFCATVFADSIWGARHMAVAPNGDVFVATYGRRSRDTALAVPGGVVVLRDENGDGVPDRRARFGSAGSSEVALFDGYAYVETGTAILRYKLPRGAMEPVGGPDTVVSGLPGGGHNAKTFVIDSKGNLFVNIGSRGNVCPTQGAPTDAPDPCAELESRAGIWRFDARRLGQKQADGEHYARGIRNAVGITVHPGDETLWSTQHGRDQLGEWKQLGFTTEYNAENPGEELFRIEKGSDFGWPYCYYAVDEKRKVTAPEYGGDGRKSERCAHTTPPVAAYPGHWAPNALLFYTGKQFPERYRDGAFIAFHGSWNRAPLDQAGFKLVFQPLRKDRAAGPFEVFADGFRGTVVHRPTGLAQAPDGSLYVSDDASGRIYRISYVGDR